MGPGHERGVPGRGPRRAGPHARPRRLQRQQVRRLLHQLISGKDNKHVVQGDASRCSLGYIDT